MIEYTRALELIASLPRCPGMDRVPLADAGGRVLAEDLRARVPSPAFTNSAMDGYAFRHADLLRGPLKIGETVVAALHDRTPLSVKTAPESMTCAKVMTGAVLPAWADTVIPFEQTRLESGSVHPLKIPEKGENIRYVGEDVQEGATVLKAGTHLDPERIMVAAAFGHGSLMVTRRPELMLCTTGGEVVEPGEPLPLGGVYNSNKYFLAMAAHAVGFHGVACYSVADDENTAEQFLAQRLDSSRTQLLITTGAVSAGDLDFVPRLAERLGFSLLFHKAAVRPGKPVFVATRKQTVWLGLPGNPLASCVGWHYFARPILAAMCGLPLPSKHWLTLSHEVRKPESLRCFFRAEIDGNAVRVGAKQGSAHFAASFTNTAYVELPEGMSHVPASTRVEAIIV